MTLMESKFKLDDPQYKYIINKKNDYIRVALNPGTSSRLNTGGDLVFEVDNQQSYLYMPDSFIHCEFSLCSDEKLTFALPIADNITLENNFFPNLFSQIRLEVGSTTVESIASSPGVVDSLLRFVTKNPDPAKNEGWIPDNNSGGYVRVLPDTATTADIVKRLNLNSKNTGYTERKELYNKNGAKQTIN